jgi:hypothetical protein
MIGDVRFADQRDGDDVDSLIVVERAKHEIMQRFDLVGVSAFGRSR